MSARTSIAEEPLPSSGITKGYELPTSAQPSVINGPFGPTCYLLMQALQSASRFLGLLCHAGIQMQLRRFL